jgi:hypothetical protein
MKLARCRFPRSEGERQSRLLHLTNFTMPGPSAKVIAIPKPFSVTEMFRELQPKRLVSTCSRLCVFSEIV